MNNKFVTGDVVKLISGGPKMTVSKTNVEGAINIVSTIWFDEHENLREAKFTEAFLQKAI